jgi:hypothetical protein
MRLRILVLTVVLVAGAAVFWGCEWSGGNSDYNTSRGAGADINISGVYSGLLAGGKAVSSTSNGNITSFTLTQTGNRIDVIDNQGSRYSGTIGAPAISSVAAGTAVLPPGWQAVQYQVSWTGKDGVAAVDVQFTGVIDLVTIDRVEATDSSSSSSSSSQVSYEYDDEDGDGQTIVIEEPAGDGTTNIIIIVSGASNVQSSAEFSNESSTESTKSYSFSEANSQLRLRGSWIEQGGRSSSVSCASPGNAGTLTVEE